MRVIDNFDFGAAAAPDRVFLLDPATNLSRTYAQTELRTHRFAHAVRARGLGSQSKIAVLAPNGVLMYETILGVLRSDAMLLPINAKAGLGEIQDILARFECDVLFYDEQFASVAEAIGSENRARENDESIGATTELVVLTESSLEIWMGNQPDYDFVAAPESEDSVYGILTTGGTTGLPKAVQFSNRNARFIVSAFESVAPFHPTATNKYPVYLASAPLTHAAGQLMQLIMRQAGTTIVTHGVSPGALLGLIERHQVTHTFLPPTVIYGMLDAPELTAHTYSTLQYLIYGASPMSPARLASAITAFGPVLAQLYGQTETGVPNAWMSPEDHMTDGRIAGAERLSAAGRITPGTELVILGANGEVVPQGETGEIGVAGDGVTPGYYEDPESTALAYQGRYFMTGDIGVIDDDGFLHIVDRLKDVIITGGFNVYSAEVERCILAYPGVGECAVFGVPDEKWGERVTALIEPVPGQEIDIQKLTQHCRDSLGPVKTPKEVIVRNHLPRSAVGKVLKRELRAEFWADQERMVS